MAGGDPIGILGTRLDVTLPPGQHAIDGFPRFGTHLHRPPPVIPTDPVIEIRGAVAEPFAVPLAELATLPRRELAADFHCVAGWSATDLHWEGVAFESFFRSIIEPSLRDTAVTHVVFGGLDGFQSAMSVEDALAEDVLIADRLDGRPLDRDHGAPARLISPNQYGHVSTKHLSHIEVRTTEPTENLGAASLVSEIVLRGPLIMRHPRARVWKEERHPYLPAWSLRRIYRHFIAPGVFLSARGGERGRTPPGSG